MDVNQLVDEAGTLGPYETREALMLLQAQMRTVLGANDGLIENMRGADWTRGTNRS